VACNGAPPPPPPTQAWATASLPQDEWDPALWPGVCESHSIDPEKGFPLPLFAEMMLQLRRTQPGASLSLSANIHPNVLNSSYDRMCLCARSAKICT
jgi:hypothetical protein